LCRYLRDYAKAQEDAGKIVYNTTVHRINRMDDNSQGHRFLLEATEASTEDKGAAVARAFKCQVLVVATGLSEPNVPSTVEGIELAEGYEDMPVDGK
jgi:cation diffusion facilitator CzcD-associated flavoprotein CzcO